ncbi:MAG: PHP domain-containing protein [Clostridiales bacterium]|nr:PHP domain-containing protein [Clostridiales bacterium]
MTVKGDYHLHTKYSDGRNTTQEMIDAAVDLGLKEIAISDHSLGTLLCHHTPKSLAAQSLIIKKEKRIKVYRSIEANIISFSGDLDIDLDLIKNLDILHAGFHRYVKTLNKKDYYHFIVKNGYGNSGKNPELIEKNTAAYINAMERYPIDVICHLGHRAAVDAKKVFECAKSNGVYIELNEKHVDVIEPIIEQAVKSGVMFILGSDAHKSKNIAKFDKTISLIEKYKIPYDKIAGIGAPLKIRPKA